MAFRYVVKKRMVGIGTKTEKYVAASYSVANIDFDRLCDQVTSQEIGRASCRERV